MGQLTNCPRCGKVFVQTMRNICPSCYEAVEQEYEVCSAYLRKKENRQATINDVSEETGVSTQQIYDFIRQGRLSVKDNPNLGIPCESCGTLITRGRLCHGCASQFRNEFNQASTRKDKKSDADDTTGRAAYRTRDRDGR